MSAQTLRFALAFSGALALAACGGRDDAPDEAIADSVEIPADEALADISEEPVVDETVVPAPPVAQREPEDTGPSEAEQARAEAVGERAAAAAADVAAIAAAAQAGAGDAEEEIDSSAEETMSDAAEETTE